MRQWIFISLFMLSACTSNPLQLAKDAPQQVGEQSLVRPPWEALVKAPPGAQNDLDLETLNGPQVISPPEIAPPQVAEVLPQPPPEVAPPPKKLNKNATTIKAVAVLNVTGASPQANVELTNAMRKVLREAGWPVLSAPRKDALTIRGTVALDVVQGNSQGVHIHWLVAEPKGKALGDIAQNNAVPAHSLDGAWGQTAGFAAQAAADGIFKLIARFR
jgi:hypothetical protein